MELTTREAIENRRSIRKFKTDDIPDEFITSLLEAARLAPSGCNAQPWRFKVVRDTETKLRLAGAAYNQSFIAQAPIVLVCCADIDGYLKGTISGIHDLGETGVVDDTITQILLSRARLMETQMKVMSREQLGARIAFNVAIAIEHIVLRALDYGLGTCWVRLMEDEKVREIFGWNENLFVVALLPLGYPDEAPPPRKRLPLRELIIP